MNSEAAGAAESDVVSSADHSDAKTLQFHALLYLVGMSASALVLFGVLHSVFFPIYSTPEELMQPMPPPEIAVAREESLIRCRLANSIVAMGIFALIAGGVLGAGEAGVRRFGSGTALRLVLGVIVGVAAGCAAAALGHFVNEQLVPMKQDRALTRNVLAQVTMMAVFGLGIGACVGIVARGGAAALKTSMVGLVAGVLAGFAFPVICATALPKAFIEDIIPGEYLRGTKDPLVLAIWVTLPAVLLGLLLPMSDRLKSRRRTSNVAPDPDVET